MLISDNDPKDYNERQTVTDKHPYISGAGNVAQAINHFRNSLPPTISADTLKKLGLAPNNESYLINILRFLGIIDAEGNRTGQATKVLANHSDSDFQAAFAELVKTAYSGLFQLRGDKAWGLDKDGLITYFRSADQTSAIIGQRQAATFQVLARLSGHGDSPEVKEKKPKVNAQSKTPKPKTEKPSSTKAAVSPSKGSSSSGADVALTVRVEVNLPADADQATYDRIFKSIRENLINDG